MKEIEPQARISPEPVEMLSHEALAAKNFYERLGLGLHAPAPKIRASYVRLAEAYYGKSDAFFLLEEAYDVLIDPHQRAVYDSLVEKIADLKLNILDILDNTTFMSAISIIESRIKEFTRVNKSITQKDVVEFFKDLILDKLVEATMADSTAFRSESSSRLIKKKVEHLISCLGINQEEIMSALEGAGIITPATR